jgi:hypothetical protein
MSSNIGISYPIMNPDYLTLSHKIPIVDLFHLYHDELTLYCHHFGNYYHIDNLKLRAVNLSPSLTVAELQSQITTYIEETRDYFSLLVNLKTSVPSSVSPPMDVPSSVAHTAAAVSEPDTSSFLINSEPAELKPSDTSSIPIKSEPVESKPSFIPSTAPISGPPDPFAYMQMMTQTMHAAQVLQHQIDSIPIPILTGADKQSIQKFYWDVDQYNTDLTSICPTYPLLSPYSMIKDPSIKLIITEWLERMFVGLVLTSLSSEQFFTHVIAMFHHLSENISDLTKGFHYLQMNQKYLITYHQYLLFYRNYKLELKFYPKRLQDLLGEGTKLFKDLLHPALRDLFRNASSFTTVAQCHSEICTTYNSTTFIYKYGHLLYVPSPISEPKTAAATTYVPTTTIPPPAVYCPPVTCYFF